MVFVPDVAPPLQPGSHDTTRPSFLGVLTNALGVPGIAVPTAETSETFKSRLGEPVPAFFTTFAVALALIASSIEEGQALGNCCASSAAYPATNGDAIDVPVS